MSKRTLVLALALVGTMFGVAMRTQAEPIVVVNNTNLLINFDSATPGAVTTTAVTGLQVGQTLIGIDYRASDGLLYGLGRVGFAGITSVYTINPMSGVATFLSNLSAPTTNPAGIDFNPTNSQLRYVSQRSSPITGGENLSINVDTGVVTTQTPLNGVAGNIEVTGAAYTNNVAGATTTQLYVIDALTNSLYTQNPPASGTLSLVGDLGVNTTNFIGFDISGLTGTAFAALTPETSTFSSFYTINLASGQASLVGQIGTGAGFVIRGLTVVPGGTPIPEPTTMLLLGTGLAGIAAKVRKRRNARNTTAA